MRGQNIYLLIIEQVDVLSEVGNQVEESVVLVEELAVVSTLASSRDGYHYQYVCAYGLWDNTHLAAFSCSCSSSPSPSLSPSLSESLWSGSSSGSSPSAVLA